MLDSSTFVLNVFRETKKMHSLLFYLYLFGCNTMSDICCNRILLANNMLFLLNVRVMNLLHKTTIKDCTVRRPILPCTASLILFRSTVRFP